MTSVKKILHDHKISLRSLNAEELEPSKKKEKKEEKDRNTGFVRKECFNNDFLKRKSKAQIKYDYENENL